MNPKAQYHSLFFADLAPGAFPLRISVETTNHCNLRCPYCPREESGRGFGYMSAPLFEALAGQCAGKLVAFAPQGFGEPFLDPKFGERLRLAHSLGVRYLDVVTNATLLDEAACRALIEARVTLVTIDLDGADKQVFERHRKNSDFDAVVANVRRLFALRQQLDSELPHISLSAVQLPDVTPSMPAFRAMWEPLLRPLDELFLAQPVTWAGARPMPGRRAATADELRTRPPCRMLYKTLQIYFDGRTSPCTYDHACKLQVGDASKQSIAEIWHGEPLRRLRQLHEQGRSGDIELCRGCPDHLP
ncbi:MAG: radical SAM protein [Planctomycetes bacterium]|nr:radical SAM protein [Planctomycetota bacterium]